MIFNLGHMLKPRVYDTRNTTKDPNNYGESAVVNVTVDNISNLPPTAVTLDPAYNVTFNGLSLRWSRSIESDFQKYEVHKSLTPTFMPDATTLVGTEPHRIVMNIISSPLEHACIVDGRGAQKLNVRVCFVCRNLIYSISVQAMPFGRLLRCAGN